MMNKTGIEYLDYTWNPIAMRCTKISEACDNCWHLRACDRMKENPKIPIAVRECYAGDRPPMIVRDRLDDPLKVKKPSIIGVQFMGDLFHESIDFTNGIDPIMAEIENCSKHTFLLLTKRPDKLLAYHKYCEFENQGYTEEGKPDISSWEWPKNIWIGTTLELQKYDYRVATLLEIPAALHFLSVEPMLEEIDIEPYLKNKIVRPCEELTDRMVDKGYSFEGGQGNYKTLDWVIAGAETGPKKRLMDLDCARTLRDQCMATGVPFFFKRDSNGNRELDGKIWEEFPEGKK